MKLLNKTYNQKFAEVNTNSISRKYIPVELQINTKSSNPELMIDSLTVALRGNPYYEKVWFATFWPERTGWYSLQIDDQLVDQFFVYPSDYCVNIDRENMREINMATLNRGGQNDEVLHNGYEPIPWFYFLLIFVFSMGYLWLEPRL